MYAVDRPGGATEDGHVEHVITEREIDRNLAVRTREAVQGLGRQASLEQPGMESVVCEGDRHEMEDRTHRRAGRILVYGDGFPARRSQSTLGSHDNELTGHSRCATIALPFV